ncbi:carnitine operon protein CaiE [Escherichia coli]|uniref:Carnitine operon protein CaiE n=1 Tax=Escherichia coli TaxID=562 RepID=A0A376RPU3_ECOLX|nr:carnitine operon protein CaiE [Escherichia coli]
MSYYAFEGLIPVVHPTGVCPSQCRLDGDVIVGAGVYIGPLASLRGDYGRLIGKREPYSGWLHYAWLLRH